MNEQIRYDAVRKEEKREEKEKNKIIVLWPNFKPIQLLLTRQTGNLFSFSISRVIYGLRVSQNLH